MMSRPRTPTTLVELTYLANRAEANLIKSQDYLPAVSVAMADAVEEYLTEPSEGEYPTTVETLLQRTHLDKAYAKIRFGFPYLNFSEDAFDKALLLNE